MAGKTKQECLERAAHILVEASIRIEQERLGAATGEGGRA